jgi:hypothetical protein
MCGEVIVCIDSEENDSLIVVADKLRVAASVRNDTTINLFICYFSALFLNNGDITIPLGIR